jgi:acyl-CoA synthetase (NDP forming)
MPNARHPFARHIRNEIAKEMPSLSGSMLDPIAAAMVVASSLAMARGRNVMTINVGDAHSMMSRTALTEVLGPLRRVDERLAEAVMATGVGTAWRRRDRKHAKLSAAMSNVLDALTDGQIRGGFLVEAMDDGHVRVTPVEAELHDHDPRMTNFIHSDDAIPTS